MIGLVMVKGVEDMVFYCYFCLVVLNEVGGNFGWFGMGVDEFYVVNARCGEWFLLYLLMIYTYDMKRVFDVCVCIVVFIWFVDWWCECVYVWWEQLEGFGDVCEEVFVL